MTREAFWRRSASVLVLAATLVGLRLLSHGEPLPLQTPLATFPARVGEWAAGETTELSEPELEQLRLSDYLLRRYEDDAGRSIWLYIGYWDSQRRGAQMHSPKHCLPGGGWEPLEAARVRIPVADPNGPIEANHFVVQKNAARQVVLYWFQSQGRSVADELDAKLLLVRNAILHDRSDGAIIRISAPVEGSVEATSKRLVQYAQALHPAVRRHLPAPRPEENVS